MKVKTILASPYLHIALIGALTIACYGRILGSYFLADDFGELRYIWQIYNGDFQLLLSNFTGNYMQIPSMAVYRPWLLMSLAIDFGIWKTSAFGYYLTNMAHYLACSIFIYFLLKKLTGYWGIVRSSLTAFSASAIFACNPLHCESISWVVGRVDIVCLSFYLAGLLLIAHYITARKISFVIGSAICFWFAIFTKEMAIGLPAMAVALAFLCSNLDNSKLTINANENKNSDDSKPQGNAEAQSEKNEFKYRSKEEVVHDGNVATLQDSNLNIAVANSRESTKVSIFANLNQSISSAKPVLIVFTICTITYFCIRYLALGTFTGGYTGSIGASQLSNILTKWLDLDSLFRILYPFNYTLMKDGGIYRNILSLAYLLTISLSICRLIFGRWPKRLLLLVFIWLITTLAPIYQLYGLGYNLEGMRFLFFATAPLSVLIPLVLFAPWFDSKDKNKSEFKSKIEKRTLGLSVFTISCLIFTFAKSSYINNSPWIEAGKQTKAVTSQIQNLAASTAPGERIGVLGIPKENAGSHMILNGPTLSFLLTPPFTKEELSERIVSFEPILYGKQDSINVQHFKWALDNESVKNYFVWEFDNRSFKKLPLKPKDRNSIEIIDISFPSLSSAKTSESTPLIWPSSTTDFYSIQRNSNSKGLTFLGANTGIGLELTPLNIKPLNFDYLEVELPLADYKRLINKSIKLSWIGRSGGSTIKSKEHLVNIDSKRFSANAENTKFIIPLSSFWQWFTYEEIKHIFVGFPSTDKLTLLSTKLMPLKKIAPSIQVQSPIPSSYGIYSMAKENKLQLQIDPIDMSLPETNQIEIEIAKNNYFFENFKGDKVKNAIWKSIKIDNNSNKIDIKKSDFAGSGYNQIRAKCVNQNGDTIGEISYPITVSIAD